MMSAAAGGAAHWDRVYADRQPTTVSWYQPVPTTSLELIDLLGITPGSAVIDIGGGASLLVDNLLERGFSDVTVLDVSVTALEHARRRLGDSGMVTWTRADVAAWQPERIYDLWHDRAVFHFLTEQPDRDAYLGRLRRATRAGSAVILGTFAPEGPDHCSGLPVTRWSAAELGDVFGDAFVVVATRSEIHRTPAGAGQPFTWVAARRTA